MLTPEQRALRARIAAHTLHSKRDPKETTQRARQAFHDSFDRKVDPDCTLSPEERERRAEHARKAYFASLALKSSLARRNKSTNPPKKKEKPPIKAAGGEV